MKYKVYMRIAQTSGRKGYKVAAAINPNYEPLVMAQGSRNERVAPTAAFAVEFEIPDEIFRLAERTLAEVEVKADDIRIPASVAYEEDADD